MVGTINPVAEITKLAHAAGALMFVDAVHYAPHGLIDVKALDCDFLACSPYKFFGPHMGTLYGKREHLEKFKPYKVRPATNTSPECWETGTQVQELIAGIGAAVEYLADLGRHCDPGVKSRREALQAAYRATHQYEAEEPSRSVASSVSRHTSIRSRIDHSLDRGIAGNSWNAHLRHHRYKAVR